MVNFSTTTWAAALLIFLAVALGTLSISLLIEYFQERRRQNDALRQLRAFTDEDQANGLLRGGDGEMPRWLRPIAARIPAFQDLDLMMDQADLKGHLPTFLLGTVGLSFAFGIGVLTLTRYWPAALVAGVIGASIPHLFVRRRRTQRMYKF